MSRWLDATHPPASATRLVKEVSVGAADLHYDAGGCEHLELVQQRGKMVPLTLLGGSVAAIPDRLGVLPISPVVQRDQGFGAGRAAHEDESTAVASDHWEVVDLVDEL